MPIVIGMKSGLRFRVEGEKITWWKWGRPAWLRPFSRLIKCQENPSGNPLSIVPAGMDYIVFVPQAELDAATKAAAEAQNQAPPGKRNIIETPGMMIPRKRPN